MKHKKARIDTYSTIYFVDIIVANQYVTLEELQKLYIYSDGIELNEDVLGGEASTSSVMRKKDEKYCILVKFNHNSTCKSVNKELNLVNTVSHEAVHVALDIYEYIHQNICFCSSEPFAYLVGYAGECIYKTLKNK